MRAVGWGVWAVVGIAAAGPAAAADPAVVTDPSPPSAADVAFSGFLIGVQAGAAWREADLKGPALDGSRGFDLDGGVLGVRVGYDLRSGPWVAGLSADIEATGGGDVAWEGAARGRFGYVLGNFLPYVTGGVSLADFDFAFASGDLSGPRLGYTVGAGVEYKVTDQLSFGAEYSYANYGTARAGAGSDARTVGVESHALRAILTYRFGDLW